MLTMNRQPNTEHTFRFAAAPAATTMPLDAVAAVDVKVPSIDPLRPLRFLLRTDRNDLCRTIVRSVLDRKAGGILAQMNAWTAVEQPAGAAGMVGGVLRHLTGKSQGKVSERGLESYRIRSLALPQYEAMSRKFQGELRIFLPWVPDNNEDFPVRVNHAEIRIFGNGPQVPTVAVSPTLMASEVRRLQRELGSYAEKTIIRFCIEFAGDAAAFHKMAVGAFTDGDLRDSRTHLWSQVGDAGTLDQWYVVPEGVLAPERPKVLGLDGQLHD